MTQRRSSDVRPVRRASPRGVDRRTFLRGSLGGVATTLGLPLLDLFLNDAGTAYASGAPLPVRFGTWFWGCGMNPQRWVPGALGRDWPSTPELAPVEPVRAHLNILSGFNVDLDGLANHPHISGVLGMLTGAVPPKPEDVLAPSLDVLISDAIGGGTRFRSLEFAATGSPRHTYSLRDAAAKNPSEVSPLALHQRVFGSGFRDPNAGEFVPDPEVLLRRSAISAVGDDLKRLERELGSHDRQRLDAYLTSLRQLEHQLVLQLEAPPPLAACRIPGAPEATEISADIDQALANHALAADILALALACDQTRVFNVVFSYGASNLQRKGNTTGHHQLTHEELVDPKLGYQPQATFFVDRSMEAFAAFVAKLASVEEGDGTLLDHCLVLAHSETSFAKAHDVTNLPIMTAGRAGGRLATGRHIAGGSDPATRVGLTVQQLMGMPVERFGQGAMETNKPVGELFA